MAIWGAVPVMVYGKNFVHLRNDIFLSCPYSVSLVESFETWSGAVFLHY